MGEPLNYEDRQLLFNALSMKTNSLFVTLGSLNNHSDDNILVKNLKEKVKQEIIVQCDNAIELLDSDLIKNDENIDAIVDYKCNKASQYHHKVLFMSDDNKDNEVRKTKELFEEAMTFAWNSLEASHPIRTWTALEFSNFYMNICNSVEQARVVAIQAYSEGISSLSGLDSSLRNDAMDNLKKLLEYIKHLS